MHSCSTRIDNSQYFKMTHHCWRFGELNSKIYCINKIHFTSSISSNLLYVILYYITVVYNIIHTIVIINRTLCKVSRLQNMKLDNLCTEWLVNFLHMDVI